MPSSQTEDILAHLKRGDSITPGEALDLYGIARLGARIWDLKQAGYQIDTEMVTVGVRRGRRRPARIARYRFSAGQLDQINHPQAA